jgi:D-aspartate ligase
MKNCEQLDLVRGGHTDENIPEFFPVIIGTDLNAYYMARCFNDEYNVRPLVLGKAEMAFTNLSNILDCQIIGDLWDEDLFVETLIGKAKELASLKVPLLLVATNDFYVRLVVKNAKALSKYYVFNYPPLEVLDVMQIKSNFYEFCNKHNIDIPETEFFDCSKPETKIKINRYPLILKPADGDEYYRHKFDGQSKIYRLNSESELTSTMEKILASGYTGKLILQEYIPGDDTSLFDCVIYFASDKTPRAVSFAQVLLQEHAPTAVGNLTALTARSDEEYMHKLTNLAQEAGYVGFGNYDIKFDARDGKYKLLELNARQGRSSYYMTCQGSNMAKLLVEDLILHKNSELVLHGEPWLFSVVPLRLLLQYVKSKKLKAEIKNLIKQRKWGNPLVNPKDKSFARTKWLFFRGINYRKKYKKYKW